MNLAAAAMNNEFTIIQRSLKQECLNVVYMSVSSKRSLVPPVIAECVLRRERERDHLLRNKCEIPWKSPIDTRTRMQLHDLRKRGFALAAFFSRKQERQRRRGRTERGELTAL